MKVTAIIVAAGKGKRAGGDIPKQYASAAGRPLLAHVAERFEQSPADEIILVVPEGDIEYVKRDIVEKYSFCKVSAVIVGGAERYLSVNAALKYLEEGGAKPDYVLIHDGARPYITPGGIKKMIDAVKASGAAIAARKAKDTVKISDEEGFILSTTARSRTWLAQTPQCFVFEEIAAAYRIAFDGDRGPFPEITDDAGVYESAFPEKRIKLVELEEENSKVTGPEDLEYMRWRLEG